MLALLTGVPAARGAVLDLTVSDVTTRAAALVWASDEPVLAASVRVFTSAGGGGEITGTVVVTLVSPAAALARGVVKVDVAGLAADTSVFMQAVTTTAGGTVLTPTAPPFVEVHTAAQTTKANAANEPIVNDLLLHDLLDPDGDTPADGTLLLVEVPGIAAHPVSAFAGNGFPVPSAVVDLNNVYSAPPGTSAEVPAGTVLRLTEFRGRACAGLANHRQLRFRRAPEHEEAVAIGAPITELEPPAPCFFADTVCDATVNVLDVQRVLNAFNRVRPSCAFHPDLDIVADGVINVLDTQSVLNRFGQSAPFPP